MGGGRWRERLRAVLAMAVMALALVGAPWEAWAKVPAPPASTPSPVYADAASAPLDYKLGVADKVRILVFNEPNLTGEYLVNANGAISFPLIGDVEAAGRTATEIRDQITVKLADGYLRSPQVSIDILSFRPFYILGEVNKPGEYPYATGLTVLNAVATANGFTYRADQRHVFIQHAGDPKEKEYTLSGDIALQPGDTIRIRERFF